MSQKIGFDQPPSSQPANLNFGLTLELNPSIVELEEETGNIDVNIPIENLKSLMKGIPEEEKEKLSKEKGFLQLSSTQQDIEGHEEIEKDELIQSVGYDNFTAKENIFSRLFFLNYFKLLSYIKKRVYFAKPNKNLSIIDFPILSEDEQLYSYIEKLRERLKSNDQKITKMILLKALFSIFRTDLIVLLIKNIIFMGLVGFNSIILNFIISGVTDKDKNTAYMWAGILFANLFIRAIVLHNSQLGLTNFSTKLRLVIICLLYIKLEKISYYNAQKANLGKIINIISGDMNTIEIKMLFIMFFLCIPITIIYVFALLWVNFGFASSIAGILPCFMIFFVIVSIQKSNQTIYKKRNHSTDERIKLANEAIDGIRLIKMYGWEKAFKELIDKIRNTELIYILRINVVNFLDRTLGFTSTYILSFILFFTFYSLGNNLTVGLVFSSLQLFDFFRIYVFLMFGIGFQLLFEVKVILQRIIDVLEIKEENIEINQIFNENTFSEEIAIKSTNYSLYWSENDLNNNKPILYDLNFQFLKDRIYVIIGKVGVGKTSFLYGLLHEIPFLKGEYYINSNLSIAYVEQEPFIMASNIRNNILFGKPLKINLYKEVLYACALHKDLINFENGDLTEVGEKGVTLSGGQRARISLARALYSEADIYLLDDPLSAIDAKVVRHVFKNAIKEKMKGKCVILVTHQIQFIEEVDEVIFLNNGTIEKQGKPTFFSEIIEDFSKKNEEEQIEVQIENFAREEIENFEIKIENFYTKALIVEHQKQKKEKKLVNRKSVDEFDLAKLLQNKNQLYKDEGSEKQQKIFMVIYKYLKQLHSPGLIFLVFILFACAELTRFGVYRIFGLFGVLSAENIFLYTGVLIILFFILCFLKFRFSSIMILKSNNNIHFMMFHRVIRTTIEFFDTNPTGRILNRFSNDMNIMDNIMNFTLGDLTDLAFYYFSMVITIFVLNPWFIIIVFVMATTYYFVMRYFYAILSDSKKLDLANKSPIFAFFSSTIQGLLNIKLYKKYSYFQKKFLFLVHHYARSNYMHYRITRTFAFTIELFSITFTGIAAFLLIFQIDDSAYFGLCLIYLLLLAEVIQWFLRQIISIITIFSSVDRSLAFTNLTSEGKLRMKYDATLISNKNLQRDDLWDKQVEKPSGLFLNFKETEPLNRLKISKNEIPLIPQQDWPQFGGVIFNNVFMRYRTNTPLVLKGLSFSIAPGEKVGCVGRTGAGKSSITQVLFRLIEMENREGSSLKIDGVDIRDLGLHTLRHSISIIPQTPFVFSGTIRRNLDPLNEYTDELLWRVLEDVDLKLSVEVQQEKLNTDMTQSNAVFSTGQKQLICLARAILKNNKILILDEATANVDLETDKFIQKKIKEKFQNCTILTIAHRLLTIANYDKVLVLEKGETKEFDEPFNLLANNQNDTEITQNTYFAELVKNTGEAASKQIFELAKEHFLGKRKKNGK